MLKKKLLISSLAVVLTSSALLASNIYMGLDIIKSGNTFTTDYDGVITGTNISGSSDEDIDSSNVKLKLGVATKDGLRFQTYLQKEGYKETFFDATNDTLIEIGIDVIKGFEVTKEFSPFIQAGLGAGVMSIEGASVASISEVSAKVGVGVMYKIVPSFELVAGYDYRVRKWQDIEYRSGSSYITLSTTEKSGQPYFGANFHF